MDGFIGEIRAFCFNYQPQDWISCNGQVLSIQAYPALYAVVGAAYGPVTATTFTLPDLRGVVPMHAGTPAATTGSPGPIPVGKKLGAAQITLATDHLPSHTHQVNGAITSNASGMVQTPDTNSLLSRPMNGATAYPAYSNLQQPNSYMSPGMVQATGGGQPHGNMQPYLGVNFCICAAGEFPMPD